jgi:hypothetical protein
MKSKLLLIPLAVIFLLSVITVVSASSVAVSLFYDQTDDRSASIIDGDDIGIAVFANSVCEKSMKVTIDVIDTNTKNKINILDYFVDIKDPCLPNNPQNVYIKNLVIGDSVYGGPGNYDIIATITGASGQKNTDSLSLTVLEKQQDNNRPVIISNPLREINEKTFYSYQVIATDADGDNLTYSFELNPNWLTISPTGLISGTAPEWTPMNDYQVTVIVSDGKENVTQTYTITVKDIANANNPPVLTFIPNQNVNENTQYSYQVTATDADKDVLTYSMTGPNWLTINQQTGLVSGISPAVSADTPFDITITVSDGEDSDSQTYVLTVINIPAPENNAPVLSAIPNQNVNENTQYSYQTTATDADGDTLTYSISGASWLTISSSGLISGTAPLVNSNTAFTITVTVSDGTDSDSETYTLTVIDLGSQNNPPIITSSPVTSVNENTQYSYQVTATDADGDSLTYSMTGPNWLTINQQTGLVSGTAPSVNSDTTFTITITVSDGKDSYSQTYVLTVKDTSSSTGGRGASGGSGTRIIKASDFEMEKYLNQFGPKTTLEEIPEEAEQKSTLKIVLIIFWILVLLLLLLLVIMLINRLRQ